MEVRRHEVHVRTIIMIALEQLNAKSLINVL